MRSIRTYFRTSQSDRSIRTYFPYGPIRPFLRTYFLYRPIRYILRNYFPYGPIRYLLWTYFRTSQSDLSYGPNYVPANQISLTELLPHQPIRSLLWTYIRTSQSDRSDGPIFRTSQSDCSERHRPELHLEIKSLAWSQTPQVTSAGSPSVKPSRHRTISDRTKRTYQQIN